MRILFIGEIVGSAGIYCVKALLPGLKRELGIDLTIAAAEGATGGFGIGKGHAVYLNKLGVDVITAGDFAYFKRDAVSYFGQARYLLRPANYPFGNPGRGWLVARPRPAQSRPEPAAQRAERHPAADARSATATRTPDAVTGKPAAGNRGRAAANREPAAANREPAAANQETAAANQEPAAANQETAAASREPAAASREPAAASQEPAAAGREPAAASREPAAASQEPAAASREPAAANREPPSGASDHSATAAPPPAVTTDLPDGAPGRPAAAPVAPDGAPRQTAVSTPAAPPAGSTASAPVPEQAASTGAEARAARTPDSADSADSAAAGATGGAPPDRAGDPPAGAAPPTANPAAAPSEAVGAGNAPAAPPPAARRRKQPAAKPGGGRKAGRRNPAPAAPPAGAGKPSGTGVGVISLLGQAGFSRVHLRNPFEIVGGLIDRVKQQTPIVLVDFHATTTSEKVAMSLFLDGKVTALIGTHVRTLSADARLLPGGTAAITHSGRTGSLNSVGGLDPEVETRMFLTQVHEQSRDAWGLLELQAVVLEVGDDGAALGISTVRRQTTAPEAARKAAEAARHRGPGRGRRPGGRR